MNETPLVDIRRFAEFSEWLKKMEKIYREDERERCAKVCESYIAQSIGKEMAAAIRNIK